MFVHEAALLATLFDRLEPSRILDCGSGDRAGRTIIQPHIAAAYAGYDTVWTDAQPSKGVIQCDYTDPDATAFLPRCEMVTACSILEHVTDIDAALKCIASLVDRWLIVSVPHVYPIHNCPIDNGWRPAPTELMGRINQTGLVALEGYLTGPEVFNGVAGASSSLVLAERQYT